MSISTPTSDETQISAAGTVPDALPGETASAAPSPAPAADPAPAPAAPANPFPDSVDSLGRKFDPEKFRVKDGQPQVDVNGRFVPAALGRKPKVAPPAGAAPEFSEVGDALRNFKPDGEAAPSGDTTERAPGSDSYTLAAAGTVSAIQTVAIMAMGAHVKPSAAETRAMVEAYAECYRHYGYKPETPPWLGPVVATAVWIGPKFQDQRSQDSLQSWKRKFVNGWLWFQGKLAGRAAASASREAST